MASPTVSGLVLVESRTARENKLAEISQDRASEILNKVKSVYFALWQGTGLATTEALAEFYEIPDASIRQLLKTHREEFELDGLRLLKGKVLKDARDVLLLPLTASQATAWTPRSALRLAMLLRDSVVAKSVRDSLLDVVEVVVPGMGQEIYKLELQLKVLQEQKQLVASAGMLEVICPGLATTLLRPDITIVEKLEVVERTVVQDQSGKILSQSDGLGITAVAKQLGFKDTKKAWAWLESVGYGKDSGKWDSEMTAHETAKLPRAALKDLRGLIAQKKGDRQRLIGE